MTYILMLIIYMVNKKRGGKGQITTYIIIGLVVLILIALTIYVVTELRQVEPRPPIPIEFIIGPYNHTYFCKF